MSVEKCAKNSMRRESKEKSPTRPDPVGVNAIDGWGSRISLLRDELQKWYPRTVRCQEEGKNPEEWAIRLKTHQIT